jgi:hypothetical protein
VGLYLVDAVQIVTSGTGLNVEAINAASNTVLITSTGQLVSETEVGIYFGPNFDSVNETVTVDGLVYGSEVGIYAPTPTRVE